MNARTAAKAMALGRIAFGAGLLARPSKTARAWVGDDVSRPISRMLVQTVGVRDLVLGLGALAALQSGQPARRWVQMAIAADAADSVLTLLHFRQLPAIGRIGALAMALGAAYGGWRIQGSVDAALDAPARPPGMIVHVS